MFIKQIVIKGVEGDVEVLHIEGGALVTSGSKILCEVRADESRESRYAKAREVAKVICGTVKHHTRWGDKPGDPNATKSMIHDVMNEIDRVAGC